MTYSIQFRKKVLKLQASGESFTRLSQRFAISKTTITRWKKKLIPNKHRNKKPVKIDYEALKKDIQEHSDSYSYERALRLGVSASGIRYAKKRLGIIYKKNTKTSKGESRKKIYVFPKDSALKK